MTRAESVPWSTFVDQCTPKFWAVEFTGLGEWATTTGEIPFPADRDVPAALAGAGLPPGRFVCVAAWRHATRGSTYAAERKRLGWPANNRQAPRCVVTVQDGDLEANGAAPRQKPAAAPAPASAVRAAQEAASIAKHRADQAAAERKALEEQQNAERVRRGAAGADDVLASLVGRLIERLDRPAPAAPAIDVAALMQQQSTVLLELLRQGQERERRMLDSLQAARDDAIAPAAVAGNPLEQVAAHLATFKDLLAIVREVDPADRAERSELSELVSLFRELAPLRGAGAAAGAVPAIAAPAAAVGPGLRIGDARVREFIGELVTELQAGSAPEWVAQKLDGQVDGLPLHVRAGLEAGDWRAAWQACQAHLQAEQWAVLDEALRTNAEHAAWLQKFAAAMLPADDGEGDADVG